MTKQYTIQCPDTGEMSVVLNLDGYEKFAVLGETSAALTDEHEFDPATKKWTKSKAREDKKNRDRQARDPLAILARIEALESIVYGGGKDAPSNPIPSDKEQ